MKGETFIRIIDDVMTQESCAKLIEHFHLCHVEGLSYNRKDTEKTSNTKKQDTSVNFSELLIASLPDSSQVNINNVLKKYVIEYIEEFEAGMFNSEVGDVFPISQSCIKIQMTKPSEGYHIWHSENTNIESNSRFLAWILYLNDVEEGGETEFLHLSERVKPKAGRLVIFPAGFTHTHRGNPPLSDTKYIATGWMEYTE